MAWRETSWVWLAWNGIEPHGPWRAKHCSGADTEEDVTDPLLTLAAANGYSPLAPHGLSMRMQAMKHALSVVLVAFLAEVAFGGDGKKEAMPDLKAIQGDWKVTSAQESRGDEPNADIEEFKGSIWTFEEKKFTIAKGKSRVSLAFRLDPKTKPKQIDFGKDLAGQDENRPYEGIYSLSGDKLTICYTVFNVRPSDFSMGRGIAATKCLVVLERVKK
jgi:uncharacterized protein (TIGR03067 family)